MNIIVDVLLLLLVCVGIWERSKVNRRLKVVEAKIDAETLW